MTHHRSRRTAAFLSLIALPLALAATSVGAAHADSGHRGSVYALSNAADGNQVLRYDRNADGSLTAAGSYASGGNGTGAGTGSQGAVILTDDGRILLAVNAGSNSVSEFSVRRDGSLRLIDTEPSGGTQPISVTAHDDTVYVLNGGSNTIVGLHLGEHGLSTIPGAVQPLTGTGAAQVQFTPGGRQLVVTEKASDLIDVFNVHHGVAGPARPTPSTGATPFGFAFTRRGTLLVANAAGGTPGLSTLSSYTVARGGAAHFVSGNVLNGQTAACWTVVSEDSRYVYTTNTGSATISGYRVARDGTLTPLNADGVTGRTGAGSRPADAAVAGSSLYVRNGGTLTITVHRIAADGSLTSLATLTGLPASAIGLAAA